MKKRLLSTLCALALCLGLLPTSALAARPDIEKAIQLADSGTAANIGGGQADNIYFGTYQQSSDGNDGYNTDPIKWRVLENADGQLFLVSDQNLDVFQYHTDNESVTWEESTMRSWLNGYGASENTGGDNGTDYTSDNFIGAAFSEKEQKAIAETTVVNDDNPNHNTDGGNNTTDKIFLLSIAEASNSSYFADDASRKSTNTAYVVSYSGMFGVGAADYWWLRSPGVYDIGAAFVYAGGGVNSDGYSVDYTNNAVRPAFNLNLNSVLFTSAAEGGKAGDGLNAVADYDGNEWKLTLLDNSRNFSISDAKTNGSGDTIVFSYSDAQTGTNEYISVVIEDEGEITHYGRILQLDGTTNGSSGTTSLTLPDGVTLGDTTKLYVFNEQYNGDKMTDYASQLKEFSDPTVDTTAPTLSNGSATRTSETSATVKFTSSEAGTCYYAVVESGEKAPSIDTTGAGTSCDTTEQIISLNNLSGAGAKDIYIVAKDAVGNISDVLKMEIPAYIAPVYDISADTQSLNFGTVTEGYEAPAEQTVTITNAGNQPQTLTQPASTSSFEVGTLSKAELPVGETVTFTVRPKAGLPVGSYSENIVVSGLENTTVSVTANFTVKQFSSGGGTTTYPVQVEENSQNGGVQVSPKNAVPGTLVTVTPQPAPGYELATLTVLDQYGNEVDVNPLGNGNYSFKMPRSRVKVEATFYCTGSELCPTHHLSDVLVKAWYHDAVDYVVEHGIMTGTSATTFEPNTTLSRAMVAQILYNLEGQPTADGKSSFTDASGHWAANAIAWAQETGVVSGYENNTFRPNRAVTREELAQMLYNYAQYKGITLPALGDLSKFPDGDEVSDWAQTAMSWANGLGAINGYEDNTLRPGGNTTRAEAASMIMGLATKLVSIPA